MKSTAANIATATSAAREAARRRDGRFGTYRRDEASDVDLGLDHGRIERTAEKYDEGRAFWGRIADAARVHLGSTQTAHERALELAVPERNAEEVIAVRRAACSRSTTLDELRALAADPDRSVRILAARNPNADQAVRDIAITTEMRIEAGLAGNRERRSSQDRGEAYNPAEKWGNAAGATAAIGTVTLVGALAVSAIVSNAPQNVEPDNSGVTSSQTSQSGQDSSCDVGPNPWHFAGVKGVPAISVRC